MANFFIGCALGLEKDLQLELNEVRPLLINESARFLIDTWNLEATKGGVALETSLIAGLQVNFWSKIANRVLLRLDSFRAQSVPRLHARLKACEIQKYLGSQSFSIKVEASKCKVSNEKTVRRLAEEVWSVDENSPLQILLRGFDDLWTVSLDTSGEHLHKRGYRQKIAAAPIRETLAALTIRRLIQGRPLADLQQTFLVDPMAGSGTMLREAFELQKPTTARDFSFMKFNNCPKLLKSPQFWGNFKNHPLMASGSLFRSSVAIEVEAKLKPVLEENLRPCEARIAIAPFEGQSRDSLGIPQDSPIWLVVNPPYGDRLQSVAWTDEFWSWVKKMKVERLAIWLPEKQRAFIGNREPESFLKVSNGGIPCTLFFFNLNQDR